MVTSGVAADIDGVGVVDVVGEDVVVSATIGVVAGVDVVEVVAGVAVVPSLSPCPGDPSSSGPRFSRSFPPPREGPLSCSAILSSGRRVLVTTSMVWPPSGKLGVAVERLVRKASNGVVGAVVESGVVCVSSKVTGADVFVKICRFTCRGK